MANKNNEIKQSKVSKNMRQKIYLVSLVLGAGASALVAYKKVGEVKSQTILLMIIMFALFLLLATIVSNYVEKKRNNTFLLILIIVSGFIFAFPEKIIEIKDVFYPQKEEIKNKVNPKKTLLKNIAKHDEQTNKNKQNTESKVVKRDSYDLIVYVPYEYKNAKIFQNGKNIFINDTLLSDNTHGKWIRIEQINNSSATIQIIKAPGDTCLAKLPILNNQFQKKIIKCN